MPELTFTHADIGYDRLYYKDKETKALYCFQREGEDTIFYRCNIDGEPSHEVDQGIFTFIE